MVDSMRRWLLVAAGSAGLLGFVLQYGIPPSGTTTPLAGLLRSAAVALFLLELALAARSVRPWRFFLRTRWPALALTALLAGEIAVVSLGGSTWLAPFLGFFSLKSVTQAYVVVVQFFILGNLLVHLPHLNARLANRRIRPGVAFLLVFLLLIAVGTGLLMLPRAVPAERPLPLLDSLFTATSAVCVTGLIVRDTATEFTPVGQGIILLLIQLGGLGIMSLTATLSLLFGRGIGIRESSLLREVFQIPVLGEVGRMLRFIVLFTFAVELVGSLVLYVGLAEVIPEPRDRLFCAVFHAVSAFCNAGFSTFSDSLVSRAGDGLLVGTIAGLLILGGLGFTVVANLLAFLRGRALRRRLAPTGRLDVQTKVILVLTGSLLLAGTALLALLEWEGAFAGNPAARKLGLAFFQAATTRTAGFHSVDLSLLSEPALFLMIVMMFVGAAPGSTAGGVKLTTVAIMWANLRAIGQGLPQTRLLGREIEPIAVRRAMVVLSGGLVVPTVGLFILLLSEGRPLLPTAFEAFSAMGTVGLSLGITPELTATGRIVITLLMFIGRLGPLTLAFGLVPSSRERGVRLPRSRIMIG